MASSAQRTGLIAPVLLSCGLAGAAVCTFTFPAVEGLGTKVRLPVFHGAMTWVNLAAFTMLAVAAATYLITTRGRLYRFAEALRWISVPLWVVGSVLGYLAAMNTWDFSGSSASPMEVAMADPRLTAQFWIMLAGLAVIALGFLIDDERWLAGIDIGFVGFTWAVLMRAILGPGRALHPDSPVMNSDEIGIKLLFFGIVISLGIAALAGVVMVARRRSASDADGAAGIERAAVPADT